jgi:hypothetical protein
MVMQLPAGEIGAENGATGWLNSHKTLSWWKGFYFFYRSTIINCIDWRENNR